MDRNAPAQLVVELHRYTRELLIAADGDLDSVERILAERAAILAQIAAIEPGGFSVTDLSGLCLAGHDAEAALDKLILLRRNTADEWQRLNHMRSPESAPDGIISLSA